MGVDTIWLFPSAWSIPTFLGNLWDTVCVPYLDDIIIFSTTFEEHIKKCR